MEGQTCNGCRMNRQKQQKIQWHKNRTSSVEVTQELLPHPYGQLGGDVTGASSCDLWVEVGRGAAQEARFEDVSTATVWEEATLVQVHLLPGRLEVQSHCTAQRVESVTSTFVPMENISASVNHIAVLWCSSNLQKWEWVLHLFGTYWPHNAFQMNCLDLLQSKQHPSF